MFKTNKRKFIWKDTSPDCMELEGALAWISKPVKDNKYLLVSWRMSGSEFCRAAIYENFEKIDRGPNWSKSHSILDKKTTNILKKAGTKVVVVITDPREVATNILHFDNGNHHYPFDFPTLDYNNPDLRKFLDLNVEKQIELIDFYRKEFKENCLVVRYEDALYYPEYFQDRVAEFVNEEPLRVDGVEKYKKSMYKNCGYFHRFFPLDDIKGNYEAYRHFYDEWYYPLYGLTGLKYLWCIEGT